MAVAHRPQAKPAADEAPSRPYDRIAVIINPASGRDRPILGVLNRAFHAARVDWEVFITKRSGDAFAHAKKAIEQNFPVVAVYGGDGTVGEVASALVGSGVPLAIFPGGTANVMSVELGIPGDLEEACALVSSGAGKARAIDVCKVPALGDRYVMLRVGIGFEATMVEGADRELKDKYGTLAYVLSALQALRDPPMASYTLTLDGERRTTSGMTCIVANTGSMGHTGLTLAPAISVSDGLVDVIVVRKSDVPSLLSVAAKVLARAEPAEPLAHWQARRVRVEVEPEQPVTVDGEIVEVSPIEVEVVPKALRVIVPATAEGVGS